MAHCLLYQDDYLHLTSNYCNDNRINKTANRVTSSVDFLDWYRGGIPGWDCLVLVSGWFRIGLSYPSLIAGCLSSLYSLFSACRRRRFSPPYLCRRGPPNSSLAVYWPQY